MPSSDSIINKHELNCSAEERESFMQILAVTHTHIEEARSE